MKYDRTKRFCLRGHDTEVVGRDSSHNCRECRREWYREDRERFKRGEQPPKRRDVAPNERQFLGDLGGAAREMRRTEGKVPASRLRVGTTREHAALAWASRWECRLDAGKKAAERLWNASRITVDCADRWCVALGTSLAIVYPEVYYEPRTAADISLIPDEEAVDA